MNTATSFQANRIKLRVIVSAFELSPSSIAEITGVSRPYVARLLSESDDFCGSAVFWSKIERELGPIIAARRGQVFYVEAVPVEAIQALTNPA